jgi:hypothetical protein
MGGSTKRKKIFIKKENLGMDLNDKNNSTPEEQYEDAWKSAEEEEKREGEPQGAEEKASGLPDEQARNSETLKPEEAQAPAPQEVERDKDHGTLESVTKALSDTKKYATDLAEQNKRIMSELDDLKKGAKPGESEDDFAKRIGDVKGRVYEDYPELKDLLDPIIEEHTKLKAEVVKTKTEREQETARVMAEDQKKARREEFNTNIRPKIIEEHPDFENIFEKDEKTRAAYFDWAKTQRPSLQFAAMYSEDPEDINWAFREFKAAKGIGRQQPAVRSSFGSRGMRGGGTPNPLENKRPKMDDYDAGWEESGERLKQEGVR